MNEQHPYENRLSEDSSFQESDEILQDDSYVREWESSEYADSFDRCETKIIARLPDLGSYKTVVAPEEPSSESMWASVKIRVKNGWEILNDRLAPMTKSARTAFHELRGKRLTTTALMLALLLAVVGGIAVHKQKRKQDAKTALAAQKEAGKTKAAKDTKIEPVEKKTEKKSDKPSMKPIEKSLTLPQISEKSLTLPQISPAEKVAAVSVTPIEKVILAPAKTVEKETTEPTKPVEEETASTAVTVESMAASRASEKENVTKPSVSTVIASRNTTETANAESTSPWERSATDGYTPWTMNSADRLVAATSATPPSTPPSTAVPPVTPPSTTENPGFSRTTSAASTPKATPNPPMMSHGAVPQHYVPTYARTPATSPALPIQAQQGTYASQYGTPYDASRGPASSQAAMPTGYYGNQYQQTPPNGYGVPQGQPTVAMTTMPGAPQYQQHPQYQHPPYQTSQQTLQQTSQAIPPQPAQPQAQPQMYPGQGTGTYQPQYQAQYQTVNPMPPTVPQAMPVQGGYYPTPAPQVQPQTASPRGQAIPMATGTVYSQGHAYQQPQGAVYSQGGVYQQGTAPVGTQRLY